jgi:uncharacterized Zn-finger protein
MHTQRSSYTSLLVVGLLTAVSLSSCSLPPGYAWRQIQRDGLIPFMQNGMSAPKAQSDAMLASNSNSYRVQTPAQPNLSGTTTAPVQKTSAPPAYAVTGLKGYVRTPFTNPPRLVDVRGMAPGAKVVCPYTQRQFTVPTPAIQAPILTSPQMMAQTQPKLQPKEKAAPIVQPKPAPAPSYARFEPMPVTPKVVPTPAPAPAPTAPKVAAAPKPEPKVAPTPAPVTKPKPVETPKVAATTPPASKPEPKTTPAPAPVKTQTTPPPVAAAAPAKLPFGAPITGRPGFVNSPYAEKHQLVDVTGLSVGTEVKCPYTGKLFRVPPQQQAKK